MSTAYRAAIFAKYAQTLMDQRAAEKVVFEGNLLREDGTADLPLLTVAREKWRRQLTLRTPDGRVVKLPSELSAEDCQQPYVRDFYSTYPKATSIIIQPGERPKDPLARQTEEVKNMRTLPYVWALFPSFPFFSLSLLSFHCSLQMPCPYPTISLSPFEIPQLAEVVLQ
jgi:hypothetical protein